MKKTIIEKHQPVPFIYRFAHLFFGWGFAALLAMFLHLIIYRITNMAYWIFVIILFISFFILSIFQASKYVVEIFTTEIDGKQYLVIRYCKFNGCNNIIKIEKENLKMDIQFGATGLGSAVPDQIIFYNNKEKIITIYSCCKWTTDKLRGVYRFIFKWKGLALVI